MIRLYISSKNLCTAALPPVGVQFTPQCNRKSTKFICILVFRQEKSEKKFGINSML